MFNDLHPTVFSDRDRRWLAYIFMALTNGIQDEIAYEALPYHDDTIHDDHERFTRLYDYVYREITACVQRVHAEEAAKIQATSNAWHAAEAARWTQMTTSSEEG